MQFWCSSAAVFGVLLGVVFSRAVFGVSPDRVPVGPSAKAALGCPVCAPAKEGCGDVVAGEVGDTLPLQFGPEGGAYEGENGLPASVSLKMSPLIRDFLKECTRPLVLRQRSVVLQVTMTSTGGRALVTEAEPQLEPGEDLSVGFRRCIASLENSVATPSEHVGKQLLRTLVAL